VTPPIRPGDVLRIPETDYLYGVGELLLRVTAEPGTERLPDGEWLKVTGMQLARDGRDLRMRNVLVRLSAVTKRQPGAS
jgi:hypothetical protein